MQAKIIILLSIVGSDGTALTVSITIVWLPTSNRCSVWPKPIKHLP